MAGGGRGLSARLLKICDVAIWGTNKISYASTHLVTSSTKIHPPTEPIGVGNFILVLHIYNVTQNNRAGFILKQGEGKGGAATLFSVTSISDAPNAFCNDWLSSSNPNPSVDMGMHPGCI